MRSSMITWDNKSNQKLDKLPEATKRLPNAGQMKTNELEKEEHRI